MGIEPTPSAWKAEVLPLNYTRHTQTDAPSKLKFLTAPQDIFGGGGRIRTYEG